MLSFNRILVTPLVLCICTAGLSACGQTGALYLPTEPSAAQRATLPKALLQTLSTNPSAPTAPAVPAQPIPPAPAASSPVTP